MRKVNIALYTLFALLLIARYVFTDSFSKEVNLFLIISYLLVLAAIVIIEILMPVYSKHKWRRIRRLAVKSKELFEAKQYEQQLMVLNELVKRNPIAANYALRASIHETLGETEKGIEDYTQAIAIEPTSSAYYGSRAFLYDEAQQYDKAISDYLQAMELNPSDENLKLYLAQTYDSSESYEKAIEMYDKFLAVEASGIEPEKIEAYIGKGICQGKLGKYMETIDTCKKGLGMNPMIPELYLNMGIAYSHAKMLEQSLECYNKSIAIDCNDFYGYYNRGILFYEQEYYNRALEDFTKAIELNLEFSSAYIWRGKTYRILSQRDKALEDFGVVRKLRK